MTLSLFFLILDFDECSLGSHDCSADAYCSNTVGSFTCTCNRGFVGDGKTCLSKKRKFYTYNAI